MGTSCPFTVLLMMRPSSKWIWMGWSQPSSGLTSSQTSALPWRIRALTKVESKKRLFTAHMPFLRSNTQRRTGAAAISSGSSGRSGRNTGGTWLTSCSVGKRSTMIFSTRTPGSRTSLGCRVSSGRCVRRFTRYSSVPTT
ncbi:hypothetical protein D9M68_753200 [compost metagenome]